jgi:hypothetical protein
MSRPIFRNFTHMILVYTIHDSRYAENRSGMYRATEKNAKYRYTLFVFKLLSPVTFYVTIDHSSYIF